MQDVEIQKAIDKYLGARQELLELSRKYPGRIGGNDNIIGRIGEFMALRFLERLGQKPIKVDGSSNAGHDLVEGSTQTQVKVITAENQHGRNVRLVEPWNQLVLIELGKNYQPSRVGLLSKKQFHQARRENPTWSVSPYVKRTMLGRKGLIGKYGRVYQGNDLAA